MATTLTTFFKKNGILTISNIFRQRLALKIFPNLKADPTTFLAPYKRPESNYALRQNIYVKKKTRTCYGTQLLDYQIPELLNLYPELVAIAQESKSIFSFKIRVKALFV